MRDKLLASALSALIVGAAGVAIAQQSQPQPQQPPQQQGQRLNDPEQWRGKDEPPGKIDGQRGNTAGRTPETGQAMGLAPSDPSTAGGNPDQWTNVSGPQTIPSTISDENAEKDAHWWLDRGQDLSPEQKQAIYAQLARDGAKSGPGVKIFAEPSAVVPLGAKLYDMPQDLAAKIPYVEDFKYVVDQSKVVLVDPVNGTVAAVIEK